ncbi:DUF7119 family protein [Halarchaeum nitratireducens]|uniref:DUF7119 domain-containing protein n=1 Tax=Halarchaeum nitratireducens TaxID=489913 RepID=A0A830G9N4_9EURY|nr:MULTISPECIES: hypothetical protein [Halarchaeum]MBP2250216.1 hypothetical protein [Halarchaeum solikamskense]GGN12046.1 hypothetical protein GCM10009021_10020 [Halarchaeum nitratireducens]
MSDGSEIPPTDRESPVGRPVIRGDERVAGERAQEAVEFDPTDPESVADAAETVASFAGGELGDDRFYMLRGAAACAALVRAEGSYKAAAERAGDGVTVSFIRKWARVHDLPRPVRRHVAAGHIAPTAAKHIARVGGEARYQLAFAAIDNDLTVREVRAIASEVNDGRPIEDALRERGVTPGELTVSLPLDTYRELRRRAAVEDVTPGAVVTDALEEYLE